MIKGRGMIKGMYYSLYILHTIIRPTVNISHLFLRFFYLILELFQQCGVFCFSFVYSNEHEYYHDNAANDLCNVLVKGSGSKDSKCSKLIFHFIAPILNFNQFPKTVMSL